MISPDLLSCLLTAFSRLDRRRFVLRFVNCILATLSAALSMAMAGEAVISFVSDDFMASLRFRAAAACLVFPSLKRQISSRQIQSIWSKLRRVSETNAFCRSLSVSKSETVRLFRRLFASSFPKFLSLVDNC